jgi:membrane-bound metal-dependent hydrolase YbcI (DUF457 family)
LDNLTHSLFGLTLARTPLARAGRGTTAALLIASNAPDIDIVATAGGAVKYLEWHRGMTHGPLGVVGLGVVTAALVWTGRRLYDLRRARTAAASATAKPSKKRAAAAPAEADASFGMLVAVSMIGVLLHVALDLPTTYGIRLLSPFDWHWFAADWIPIVDIYLLVVLIIGLLGKPTPAQARTKAAMVFVLMAANYGVRGFAHHEALVLAPQLFGPTLPAPCDPPVSSWMPIDRWPRSSPPSSPPPGKRCLVEMVAEPSFTSPFSWRIIAQMSNAYEIHDLNLLDQRVRDPQSAGTAPWRVTLRYPNVWTPAIARAATTHLGTVFLGFSRFPAARFSTDAQGVTMVRWTDMRFAGGTFGLDQPSPRAGPFTATVRLGADGQVLDESLGIR